MQSAHSSHLPLSAVARASGRDIGTVGAKSLFVTVLHCRSVQTVSRAGECVSRPTASFVRGALDCFRVTATTTTTTM